MKLSIICGFLFLVEIVASVKHHRRENGLMGKGLHHQRKHTRKSNLDGQRSFKNSMRKLEKFSHPNTNWHVKKSEHENDQHLTFYKSKKSKELLDQKFKEGFTHKRKHDGDFGKHFHKQRRLNGRRPVNRFSRRRSGKIHRKEHDVTRRGKGMKHTLEQMQNIKTRGDHKFLRLRPIYDEMEKAKERFHTKDRKVRPGRGFRRDHHLMHRQPSKKHLGPDSMFCKVRSTRKCPDFKREVCGSDGKTYQNRCVLVREMCKKEDGDILVTKRGPCDKNFLH